MDIIRRDSCVFTDKNDLEPIYDFDDFPIFMGCTERPIEEDIKSSMSWWISKGSGSIQLNPLVPLDVLYGQPHNDAFGGVWEQHHSQFSKFINKYTGNNVLEVGGANGILAHKVHDINPAINWTLIEPNPRLEDNSHVNVIRGFFDENFSSKGDWDTFIHSHTFEHAYNPILFLKNIRKVIPSNGRHIFSLPNMKALLRNNYTNCLNFEHTYFIIEDFLDWMLGYVGFKILEKKHFEEHSIFYSTEVSLPDENTECPNLYEENKNLFNGFIKYHENIIVELNEKINAHNGDIYLFGAHVFSQFLINFGLDCSNIIAILDNSPQKIGKRLYGTNLKVMSPSELKDKGDVAIILKAANYNKEIKDGILNNHNNKAIFWE